MKALKTKTLNLKDIEITDEFWKGRIDLAKDIIIPYQWDALNDQIPDAAPSHAIKNFEIAAGLSDGEFKGMVFQDSDVAKWLEAASYSLIYHPDKELEQTIDEVIELIGKAQQDDGYLNTYFTVKEPEKRWADISHGHELYCAGHMIEAAVAYYNATSKKSLIDIVCRYVDYIMTIIGPEQGKIQTYPGHPEIELALVRLYEVTQEQRYFELSRYFVEERGNQPSVFLEEETLGLGHQDKWFGLDYHQAHQPLNEQTTAEGHAVRAVYLYAGIADIVKYTQNKKWKIQLEKLWENVTQKRMYITGGIGSQGHGERFTLDYDLPNNVAYAETCASIGLVFWAQRMLQIEAKNDYADVLEKALYNGVLSGMSLDGKKYFYVNPLEVAPELTDYRHDHVHVESERVGWFGCACCPPNVARLLTSLGNYIYTQKSDTIYHHLYIGNKTNFTINKQNIVLQQKTTYPATGEVRITCFTENEVQMTLKLRKPKWSNSPSLKVNGELQEVVIDNGGYITMERKWRDNDTICLTFDMTPKVISSHPKVRENVGKVAIQRGPIVYCLEEKDNGGQLHSICINPKLPITEENDLQILGFPALTGSGVREVNDNDTLYREYREPELKQIKWKAIPYSFWGNRGKGEMAVWLRKI